jgi:hypothetical protein
MRLALGLLSSFILLRAAGESLSSSPPAASPPIAATGVNQISAEEAAGHWKLLFDGKTTAGWRGFKKKSFPAKGWDVENDWLHCQVSGGGDIITDQEFNDFELTWEWKIAPEGNSGVKYFITEKRDSAIGHEYQMIDDQRNPDARVPGHSHVTASFYDVLKPEREVPVKGPGEINSSKILVKGNHVEHWINGVKVLEYSCGSETVREAVQRSKFKKVPNFGDKIPGHILLQDHHSEVWFRNIKLRELKAD